MADSWWIYLLALLGHDSIQAGESYLKVTRRAAGAGDAASGREVVPIGRKRSELMLVKPMFASL